MEIKSSARRHGVSDDDIRHAFDNALRIASYEYDGEERLLIIGPDSSGACLNWSLFLRMSRLA